MENFSTLGDVLDGKVECVSLRGGDDAHSPVTTTPDALQQPQETRHETPFISSEPAHEYSETRFTSESNEPGGFCVECEDQPYALTCHECADVYCELCFMALHRKGKRRHHSTSKIQEPASPATPALSHSSKLLKLSTVDGCVSESDSKDENQDFSTSPSLSLQPNPPASTKLSSSLAERAKWIPLRLSFKERKMLRLLEAALTVSEYTDKIDVISHHFNKTQRIVAQIKDLCAILCGLVVASDYQTGQALIGDKVGGGVFVQGRHYVTLRRIVKLFSFPP